VKIQEARAIATRRWDGYTPGETALVTLAAAVVLAAVLDQIEQACNNYGDYEADGLLRDIGDILNGERT
jgi:hypothetical protein